MRGLVQRVETATVRARSENAGREHEEWEVTGSIGAGLCVLVGVTHTDTEAEAHKLARKIAGLRIMDDDDGVMNRSVVDVGGAVLIVSQFTLYGDTSKGRRPTWTAAAPHTQAEPLVELVIEDLRNEGIPVETGRFRAEMKVELINDGPATVLIEI